MTTYPQMKYYRSVVLPRIAKVKKMDLDQAHDWLKREYFGGSTKIWNPLEFEEIIAIVRSDFSREVWIPQPNEQDLPPYQPGYDEPGDLHNERDPREENLPGF